MKLTTTFNMLRKAGACESGYKKLAKSLGCVSKYGADTPINLLHILESNGMQDVLWCLRATEQPEGKRIASKLAIEFAADALPIFEAKYPNDNRPRLAIQGARDFLEVKISAEDLMALRRAANAAADAAYAAYAANAAADAANARQKAKDRQAAIIRMMLAD